MKKENKYLNIGVLIGTVITSAVFGIHNWLTKPDYTLNIDQKNGVYSTTAKGTEHWTGFVNLSHEGDFSISDIIGAEGGFSGIEKEASILCKTPANTPVANIKISVTYQD